MIDEKIQKLYDAVSEGIYAERLHEKLGDFFDEIRKEIFNEWKMNRDNWQELKAYLDVLDRFEAIMLRKIDDYKVAEQDLKNFSKEE